jgi:hypothetical protein
MGVINVLCPDISSCTSGRTCVVQLEDGR